MTHEYWLANEPPVGSVVATGATVWLRGIRFWYDGFSLVGRQRTWLEMCFADADTMRLVLTGEQAAAVGLPWSAMGLVVREVPWANGVEIRLAVADTAYLDFDASTADIERLTGLIQALTAGLALLRTAADQKRGAQ